MKQTALYLKCHSLLSWRNRADYN